MNGQVARSGTLKNVVVCMDLNANNACDADEPASAPTGADGLYTLTYDTSKISADQAAAAQLIAPVLTGDPSAATTAIDSDFPTVATTTSNYVLTRPAGSAGPINPLTTLVQAGIADGMTEAAARNNVALQLDIAATKIDNYQDDPPQNVNLVQDNARIAAAVVSAVLKGGGTLSVGDQLAASAAAASDLASLNFTDVSNFNYRQFFLLEKAAGTSGVPIRDLRTGRSLGGPASKLYPVAYLTGSGWRHCTDANPFPSTRGNPNRSTYCGVSTSIGFRLSRPDLAGKSMADVVADMASASGNTVTNTPGLISALGNARFPAGSTRAVRYGLDLTTPLYINNVYTDARSQSIATTLEQLVAAYQTSKVDLANGGWTLSLGILESAVRNLRVAFTNGTAADSGPVQYYGCDLNTAQTVVSNCAAIATGTYSISTVNGVRVMRFAGHPATVMNHTRGYAEVDWGGTNGKWVYVFRENKPTQTARAAIANRLDATAWAAMKAQLGI
ncbi:hypothetical protein [Ottowia sp.]|uniref:hypothetical protein n=1 Tax=Ottowia sp. TaxID=1898956 RepID=UPI00262C1FBE|nr:hypothetical protein [Ottowia sp.]